MLKIQEDVRENIENMKTFLQRRIIHLTKRRTSDWDAREKNHSTKCLADIGRKRDERRNFEGMIDRRRTKRWRREESDDVGEKFYVRGAHAFFVPRVLEKKRAKRRSRNTKYLDARSKLKIPKYGDESVYRTHGTMKVVGQKSKRDLCGISSSGRISKSNLRSGLNQVSDIETSCKRRRW